jgi:hypothetical protein
MLLPYIRLSKRPNQVKLLLTLLFYLLKVKGAYEQKAKQP